MRATWAEAKARNHTTALLRKPMDFQRKITITGI